MLSTSRDSDCFWTKDLSQSGFRITIWLSNSKHHPEATAIAKQSNSLIALIFEISKLWVCSGGVMTREKQPGCSLRLLFLTSRVIFLFSHFFLSLVCDALSHSEGRPPQTTGNALNPKPCWREVNYLEGSKNFQLHLLTYSGRWMYGWMDRWTGNTNTVSTGFCFCGSIDSSPAS